MKAVRQILALALSLVMIASLGTAMVFATPIGLTGIAPGVSSTHDFYKAGNPDAKVESTVTLTKSTAFKVKPKSGSGSIVIAVANVTFGTAGIVKAVRENDNVIRLVPLANGTTTVVYTDGAIQAEMTVTVSGAQTDGWYTTGQNPAEAGTIHYDGATDSDSINVGVKQSGKFIPLAAADYTVSNPSAVTVTTKAQGSGGNAYTELMIQPKRNGTTAITHTATGKVLTIIASNILSSDDYTIPDNADLATINAAIASRNAQGNTIPTITLPNKSIAGEIVLPTRVKLAGQKNTVLTGSVHFTVSNPPMGPMAGIMGLKMQAATTGSGTAVYGTGHGMIVECTIENYAKGVEMGSEKAFFTVESTFKNNTTALEVKTVQNTRVGIGGLTFTTKAGQVAMHVLSNGTNNNEFAFKLDGSNFYGAGTYIKNDSGINNLNMSGNFFANYEPSKFT
ncbi:MAG: hypothetical protein RR185_09320, partial [Angelakisella sp.]